MAPPPPLPILRTTTLTVRGQTEPSRSYLIFRARGATEDVWLRRDLLVSTRATPTGLWVAGLFKIHDRPNFIHLSCDEADATQAQQRIDAMLHLPPPFQPVSYDELVNNPEPYSGTLIDCSGTWTHGFENSRFAHAWVTAPHGATIARNSRLELRMQGRFHYSSTLPAYGHLGMSHAAFAVFDTSPRLPGVQISWLDPDASGP